METKLKARDRTLLEKIFAAEIAGHSPYQSRSKEYPRLADEGLVAPMRRTFGGRFPVLVSGWALTELGRMMYCAACAETPDAKA